MSTQTTYQAVKNGGPLGSPTADVATAISQADTAYAGLNASGNEGGITTIEVKKTVVTDSVILRHQVGPNL